MDQVHTAGKYKPGIGAQVARALYQQARQALIYLFYYNASNSEWGICYLDPLSPFSCKMHQFHSPQKALFTSALEKKKNNVYWSGYHTLQIIQGPPWFLATIYKIS